MMPPLSTQTTFAADDIEALASLTAAELSDIATSRRIAGLFATFGGKIVYTPAERAVLRRDVAALLATIHAAV